MARWVFVIGIAMVACGGGGGGSSADLPRVAATQAADQACSRDTECTLVDDCCGCDHAGAKTAVRVDRVEALSAAAQSECAGRTCPDLPSEHRSCQATAARCSGGRCIPGL